VVESIKYESYGYDSECKCIGSESESAGVNRITYSSQGVASLYHRCRPPLPFDRQHPSYGDCLEVKGEYCQSCSVLGCSQSAAHYVQRIIYSNNGITVLDWSSPSCERFVNMFVFKYSMMSVDFGSFYIIFVLNCVFLRSLSGSV